MSAPAATPRTARVVVGVDGSEQSRTALVWAAFLAGSMQASLEAIICWDFGTFLYESYPRDWDPATDARTVIDKTLDEAFGQHDRPKDLTVSVRQGTVTRTLLQASTDADLLVVGSRGHGGFAGLLLGSVSAACAEHARCPVLVVHGSTAPPPTAPSPTVSGAEVS